VAVHKESSSEKLPENGGSVYLTAEVPVLGTFPISMSASIGSNFRRNEAKGMAW
jgi:hypothetical protein